MTNSTLPDTFWGSLESLCRHSRLVLVAIERDDVAEISRLTDAAELLIADLKPAIEARIAHSAGTDEDRQLHSMLFDLKSLNDRIRVELEEKARVTRNQLEVLRERKLRLVSYRHEEPVEAVHFDKES